MLSARLTRMVLSPALFAFAVPAILFAQTTTATHSTTTAVHRRVTPAATTPALPKNIPPVKAVTKTAFALRYQDIKLGDGDEATAGAVLSVNYTGWLASDGTKFDSSYDRGQPFQFPQGMRRVIVGWDEGLIGMKVGGKRRLFIPYQLAYGTAGRGSIPSKADLIFDVELMAVRSMISPESRVPHVSPPPAAPAGNSSAPQTPPASSTQPAQPQQSSTPQ